MTTRRIPTYTSDGQPYRAYSIDAIKHLERMSKVVVRRNGYTGAIVSAYFRAKSGFNPLRATAHMGQRYSFPARIRGLRSQTWAHCDLLADDELRALYGLKQEIERESRDLFVRGVFRAVPLSILRREHPPNSIESGRDISHRAFIEGRTGEQKAA